VVLLFVQVSVSILSLDYEDKTVVEQALMRVSNANSVHLDVMDGKFVKEKSFDHELVAELSTDLKKTVHLMIKQPDKVVDKYIKAGADTVIFHLEACRAPRKLLEHIKKKGVKVGLAISPETPVKKIEPYLKDVDMLLVMTVKPGKGGQKLLKTQVTKVKSIRKKMPMLDLAVDGGVNADNAHELIEAGANILVSGSYIFNSTDPKIAVDILRNA